MSRARHNSDATAAAILILAATFMAGILIGSFL